VAAVASFADARAMGGSWLVRMEDVDEPRSVPGADRAILQQLSSYGLEWDGEVLYQSRRGDVYQKTLDRLSTHTFGCICTRRDPVCLCDGRDWPTRSVKLRFPEGEPFVLKRADGFFAYQLAVVVDDFEQGVTHVVRGADLADSTPRHRYLQHLLGYPSPDYFHVPVAAGPDGQKLSKQNGAPPIPLGDAEILTKALKFLGQSTNEAGSCRELLDWGVRHWSRESVPGIMSACV
jgi:glutamyl-Q tRNA(Asp) synthetase